MLPQLADGRADLYSLGAIAFRLLSARSPSRGRAPALPAPDDGHQPPAHALGPTGYTRRPGALGGAAHRAEPRGPAAVGRGAHRRAQAHRKTGLPRAGTSPSRPRRACSRLRSWSRGEAPLKRLRARFDLAARGEGSVVLISAAAGDGKTRLVEELRAHVEASGGFFLRTQANEVERNLPFYAVREVIDEYVARSAAYRPSGERRSLPDSRARWAAWEEDSSSCSRQSASSWDRPPTSFPLTPKREAAVHQHRPQLLPGNRRPGPASPGLLRRPALGRCRIAADLRQAGSPDRPRFTSSWWAPGARAPGRRKPRIRPNRRSRRAPRGPPTRRGEGPGARPRSQGGRWSGFTSRPDPGGNPAPPAVHPGDGRGVPGRPSRVRLRTSPGKRPFHHRDRPHGGAGPRRRKAGGAGPEEAQGDPPGRGRPGHRLPANRAPAPAGPGGLCPGRADREEVPAPVAFEDLRFLLR